jgi:hypothetical protein
LKQTRACRDSAGAKRARKSGVGTEVAWKQVARLQQRNSTTARLEVDDRWEDAGTQGLEDTRTTMLIEVHTTPL